MGKVEDNIPIRLGTVLSGYHIKKKKKKIIKEGSSSKTQRIGWKKAGA